MQEEVNSDDDGREYFDHIRRVNDIFYDQIRIADQKAAYIFTFLLAFLVSSSEGRGVFSPAQYSAGHAFIMVFSALLAMSSIFSIICAIFVILPRKGGKTTTLFWGAWPVHRDNFVQASRERASGYLFRQYLENADTLSIIARGKYRFVGLAFRGLVVTVLSYVCLLMVA